MDASIIALAEALERSSAELIRKSREAIEYIERREAERSCNDLLAELNRVRDAVELEAAS